MSAISLLALRNEAARSSLSTNVD